MTAEKSLPLTVDNEEETEEKNKNSNNSNEAFAIISILIVLILIYVYLLMSPSQPRVPPKPRNFVIQRESKEKYQEFLKSFQQSQSSSYDKWEGWGSYSNHSSNGRGYYDDVWGEYNRNSSWGGEGQPDDFFLDPYKIDKDDEDDKLSKPIVPSTKYRCQSGWVTIRSELNYKYLWMHSNENLWMGASASMDTPLHRKAFEMVPVHSNCSDGWLRLREGDSQGFVMMVPPTGNYSSEEWVIKVGSANNELTDLDERYHFLLEEEGYVLNRGAPMAFVNVMADSEYPVRGHSSGWNKNKPAGREYGAFVHFQLVNDSQVIESLEKEAKEQTESNEKDLEYIAAIKLMPNLGASEKQVISFGLYGSNEKYTTGAIRNAELAKIYFPGWVCRYYITSDVPLGVIDALKELGAEIEDIPSGMGYSSGMFWRFIVASDESVDRYIVRDVDSRLNARDRFAVEEWIQSKYPVHILRDHVNHCIVMNGGMWGGTKHALSFMKDRVESWKSRDEYMADLHFLEKEIWPDIKHKQISHDSYCCDRFPNTRPYPTKRYSTYQHVGQVFDKNDNPRLADIDGFIRGIPTPGSCRAKPDWIYG